jgi:alkylation response protein AidB-like acyl-CoA dehydrogenase
VIDRGLIFGVWNTEMSNGVKLLPEGEGTFRVEGAKSFASGAGHIHRPLVTGLLPDGGWQIFVVPADEADVSVDESWWRPIGMKASATFNIDLSGIIIDERAFIGSPGDYHRQPWFTGGAIRFAAVQFGGAVALLDETRRLLQELDRTADPYQRARIADGTIAAQSGDLWLRRAADMLDASDAACTPDDIERITVFANMTRTVIERISVEMIQLSQQSAGVRSLFRPHPSERIIRDLTMYLRQPAPDAALEAVGAYSLKHESSAAALWGEEYD